MYFFRKNKKYIIICGIFMIFLISTIFIYYKNSEKKEEKIKIADAVILEDDSVLEEVDKQVEEVKEEEYYVDVKGAVINPGVYKLSVTSRINDAINLAGGVTTDADTRCVNLSKKIKDEMVIYVYTKQEVEDMYKENKKENNVIFNNIVNDAYVDYTNPEQDVTSDNDIIDESTNNKININTADISLLTTLPNIGESKAQAIIDKRQELGNFSSIDQLKEVTGIGEATFEKLKDLITIE